MPVATPVADVDGEPVLINRDSEDQTARYRALLTTGKLYTGPANANYIDNCLQRPRDERTDRGGGEGRSRTGRGRDEVIWVSRCSLLVDKSVYTGPEPL